MTRCASIVSIAWLVTSITTVSASDEQREFFETSIRPLLAEHCVQCHGEQEQSGGLRLDSQTGILKGGDNGPVIDLKRPDSSRLLVAIRRTGEIEMPPDQPLSKPQIGALTAWVKGGAYWPGDRVIHTPRETAAQNHWAFQPVVKPPIPQTAADSWCRTPIDAFVLARLTSAGLSPVAEADRRTLIRRAAYTLTGLPPTPEQVDQFVRDPSPVAYEELVDRLLESPHYGEHWARHWLDVARYSDTKGYVYAREERFWLHAWAYRDWVVQALNNDMPYDRFLLLQLAADQVEDAQPGDLAAMGFLTLGRRFLGVERDIIDDRIDVVCRGTMGLTVACARCHDHKYDPIPTADYYSLYGVFDSCREEVVRLSEVRGNDEFEAELKKRQSALLDALEAARKEGSERVRSRVVDYLTAQTQLDKYPPKGFDQIFSESDILPAFVRRWESYLRATNRRSDPVFVPWHRFAALTEESFDEQATTVTEQLQSEADAVNPLVLEAFTTPPKSFAEVIDRYAMLLGKIDDQWQNGLEAASQADNEPPTSLDDEAAESLRRVLYGPQSPCTVPDESIVHIESHVDSGTCTKLWNLQKEVDRWLLESSLEIPMAVSLVDRETPSEPRVFHRGNPARPAADVPRQFLSLLAGPDQESFATGSGRRELADAIIDPGNPLTARVIVNRVWAHHFGTGLIATTSDFGTRAGTPSHPLLLDWLASQFVADGWNLKNLHRMFLCSSTFRQSSVAAGNSQQIAQAMRQDPENRLLWRMSPKRLAFEEFRDSLLVAGSDLDPSIGGKPADLLSAPFPNRRTLYGLVDRQFFPNTLRVFDFANPDLHIPERPETTVPQQALFFMNHPFVLERARALATDAHRFESREAQIQFLYRRGFQREPTDDQSAIAMQFLDRSEAVDTPRPSLTAGDWQYGYGSYDETAQRVSDLTPLPHFSGDAWQGGEKWPDPKLGWVQLNSRGGHPGNDRAHAAIRRWTAPRQMVVDIRSTLIHEAAPGDGIRSFVVSSSLGLMDSATVHQQTHEFNTKQLNVDSGETIDFVVDIGDVLNNDQFLWSITITEPPQDQTQNDSSLTWNSTADFPQNETAQLTPLEQLAHVLLSSNEFLFID